MTYNVGRLGPQELRTVYSSNTAAGVLTHGRCVAVRIGGTVASDTGDGTGWGYAVDYPLATSSICVGVLYSADGSTYRAGSPALCIRQGVATARIFATSTIGDLMVPYVGTKFGFCSAIGAATPTSPILHYGIFGVSLAATTGTTTVTGTMFVNSAV